LDLPLHLVGEVVDVGEAHAAGVDQLEEPAVGLDQRGHPVARDAGGRVDDGDAPARQPVEQRRLADVGPAHDGNDRDYQGTTLRFAGAARPAPRPPLYSTAAAGRRPAPRTPARPPAAGAVNTWPYAATKGGSTGVRIFTTPAS